MNLELRKLVEEVLSSGYLLSLATVDEGGPWVADVIFIYDDELNIYWMSDDSVRHSRAIKKNKIVAGSITISGQGENNLGIQFTGPARRITGARYDLAKKHYAKRKKPLPQEKDDVLQGDSWYVVHLQKIDLIDEKKFGFGKQSLDLGA